MISHYISSGWLHYFWQLIWSLHWPCISWRPRKLCCRWKLVFQILNWPRKMLCFTEFLHACSVFVFHLSFRFYAIFVKDLLDIFLVETAESLVSFVHIPSLQICYAVLVSTFKLVISHLVYRSIQTWRSSHFFKGRGAAGSKAHLWSDSQEVVWTAQIWQSFLWALLGHGESVRLHGLIVL